MRAEADKAKLEAATKPKLIRYPAIDPDRFREAVTGFASQHPDSHATN